MIRVCFFFKQKTAYEMRISDWSSDVCSSDLRVSPPNIAGPAPLQDKTGPALTRSKMMRLSFIDLGKLSISKANMRYAKKAPDVSDILPTVRARGVLVPLIVRPNCGPDAYEIVAGARRFTAAQIVAAECAENGVDVDPLPCAILEDGDDADAIEASMIENFKRLDPDEVTRWESFVRLVKEGRSIEEIGRAHV